MRISSISFASESFRERQKKQSSDFRAIGLPNSQIYESSPLDLPADPFWRDNPNANETNSYGWFTFKPIILLKALQKIKHNDLLIYLDCNDRPKQGLLEYIEDKFESRSELHILGVCTNYANIRYMSGYHASNLSLELVLGSFLRCQPEAGLIIMRNTKTTQIILRLWYEANLMNSMWLTRQNRTMGRHDQETLYLVARLNRCVRFESWYKYKFLGVGIRKYIDFEYYRSINI